MKRIFSWLRTMRPYSISNNLPPDGSSPQSDQTDMGVKLSEEPQDLIDDTSVPSRPSQYSQMPDIYADVTDVTVPDLRVLDDLSQEGDESDGFDPYDTAVFIKNNGSS